MAKLFDYNNLIWRMMGRIADLFLLTLLWIICSIPIVTIGASTSALYYVALKMVKNHEQYLCRMFFKYMKENFMSSTLVGVFLMAIGLVLTAGFWGLEALGTSAASVFFWMILIFTVLFIMVTTLAFPLSARLDTDAGNILMMAFMVVIKQAAWSFLMAVISACVLAVGVLVFWPVLLLGAGVAAYLHALILEHIIFPKYNWTTE